MSDQPEILTIGHSTHAIEDFTSLLIANEVSAIADVRSQPFSRFAPQFNKGKLSRSLQTQGIRYAFVGNELGARTNDPGCYVDGRVQYNRLAETAAFKAGLQRVLSGSQNERIALMCTEKDPLDCHRTVLVANQLIKFGARISHIRADGSVESHDEAMDRLMLQFGMQPSFLQTREEQVEEALSEQESRIAYVDADLAAMSQRAVS